jgi:hypothetical protein
MSAVPADSDPITDFPRIGAGTERVDHSRDLVTWRAWKHALLTVAFFMINPPYFAR